MPGRSVIRSFWLGLEHDAIGGQAEVAVEQRAGVAVHQPGVEQAGRRDIEKQSARQALCGKGAQAGLPAGVLQFEELAAAGGRGEQLIQRCSGLAFRPRIRDSKPRMARTRKSRMGWKTGITGPPSRCAGVPLPRRY